MLFDKNKIVDDFEKTLNFDYLNKFDKSFTLALLLDNYYSSLVTLKNAFNYIIDFYSNDLISSLEIDNINLDIEKLRKEIIAIRNKIYTRFKESLSIDQLFLLSNIIEQNEKN